jgi:phosphorylase kinase alpha/beta subunit
MHRSREASGDGLKSPLVKSLGGQDLDEFDLIDQESEIDRQVDTPGHDHEEVMTPLALILGNPTQTQQAIEMISSCSNLYDQMDLLHYLYSCHGGDYILPKIAKLSVLLEEVYWKAMVAKQWSIVRHAAGWYRILLRCLEENCQFFD